MKYLLTNPLLDKQIDEIRLKIRLSMNGIVADQLTKNGIIYAQNFGVTIPRIKQIAGGYTPNHDLAQRLWHLHIRETMIMATLLQPINNFTREIATGWMSEINHIELVEQSCMNLFNKLSFANQLCCDWVNSDQLWTRISGFVLAARIYSKLTDVEVNIVLQKAFDYSQTDEYHLYKAIALCLSRCCRINKETADFILKKLKEFEVNTTLAYSFITEEVNQEILFLNNL